ncbi:hypothetical protein ACLOAV_002303 [Pseudogymnoascus australis]
MVPIKSEALQGEGEMVEKAADPVENLQDDDLVKHIIQLREKGGNARVTEISDSYVAKYYGEEHIDDVVQAIAKAESLNVRVPISNASPNEMDISNASKNAFMGVPSWMPGLMLGTGLCRSMWLDDRFGVPARALPLTISSIVNFWHNLVSFRREARKSPEEHRQSCEGPTQPEEGGLVFTHHDPAPRNLILESSTRNLWIVDWDDAGWYPRYFEFAGMCNFIISKEWGRFDRLRWDLFTWITTGWYRRESRCLVEVYRKLTRFPVARRFNIMAGATLS